MIGKINNRPIVLRIGDGTMALQTGDGTMVPQTGCRPIPVTEHIEVTN
jgi:hypothetical protein